MDPLHPIVYGPSMPSRRVPPVERLPRVSREGDRPRREPSEKREGEEQGRPRDEGEDGGGHIDVRV
ncbi:MAG TPA: hypothetical protein VGH56_10200 [Solirubrobacteraceae bacterium]